MKKFFLTLTAIFFATFLFANTDCKLSADDIITITYFQEAKRSVPVYQESIMGGYYLPEFKLTDKQILECIKNPNIRITGRTSVEFAGYERWFPFFQDPVNLYKTYYWGFVDGKWSAYHKIQYGAGPEKGIFPLIVWIFIEALLIFFIRKYFTRFINLNYKKYFFNGYEWKKYNQSHLAKIVIIMGLIIFFLFAILTFLVPKHHGVEYFVLILLNISIYSIILGVFLAVIIHGGKAIASSIGRFFKERKIKPI